MGVHVKKHGLTSKEYISKYEPEKVKEHVCMVCGKDISHLGPYVKICSEECRKVNDKRNEQEYIEKHNKKYEKFPDIPVCKICGWKSTSLHTHVLKHKLTLEEYKKKFNIIDNKEIFHKSYTENQRKNWSGEKNPGFNHQGKLSPWSKKNNYITDEQREKAKEKALNRSYTTRLDYYLKRTNNEEVARKLLHARQDTCSLESFIKRYGEEKGRERWEKRNEQWKNSYPHRNYSQISQELFWKIYKIIENEFNEVYFATLDNTFVNDNRKTYEYCIKRYDGRWAFLDFYIKDLDKAIEFDGLYWHQNKDRDEEREVNILLENPNLRIFHVKEEEYRENSEKVIQECLNFIYSS